LLNPIAKQQKILNGLKETVMSIGQAYADILTPREQQALAEACDWLIDHAFDECERREKPQDVLDSVVGGYLPTRYVYRYTTLFFKKFAVCMITVVWKLAQSELLLLSSLAEELAVLATIQEAKERLEDRKNAFDTCIARYFEESDGALLFDDRYDGLDETEVAQMLGLSSLALADWFLPCLDAPSRVVHPYALEV
jgi:hypothetical protein